MSKKSLRALPFVAAIALVVALAPCAAFAGEAEDLAAGDIAVQAESGLVPMYRLYNQWSGEHFYTANAGERDGLVEIGWTYEGVGWNAPATSNTPVYRLYNSYGAEHHYTMSAAERDTLIQAGWTDEKVGWYSDDAKAVPLMRDYNPNEPANNHNYTASEREHAILVNVGWRDEGVAWYGATDDSARQAFEGKWVVVYQLQANGTEWTSEQLEELRKNGYEFALYLYSDGSGRYASYDANRSPVEYACTWRPITSTTATLSYGEGYAPSDLVIEDGVLVVNGPASTTKLERA